MSNSGIVGNSEVAAQKPGKVSFRPVLLKLVLWGLPGDVIVQETCLYANSEGHVSRDGLAFHVDPEAEGFQEL